MNALEHQAAALSMTEAERGVWRDILSQAVTGELIGAMNYQTLSLLYRDATEKIEALEHAAGEQMHAVMFRRVADSIDFEVRADVDAPYWARVRAAFLNRAAMGDTIGCVIIQEVMLESFAVASYRQIANAAPPIIGETFGAIATEEAEHVGHAVALLRGERARDPEGFDASAHAVHEEVMTTLAEMVAREDRAGHCGLCQGSCVKPSLPLVGLATRELRGSALRQYLLTLDAIGVPGEVSLTWVAGLPV